MKRGLLTLGFIAGVCFGDQAECSLRPNIELIEVIARYVFNDSSSTACYFSCGLYDPQTNEEIPRCSIP